jgi:sialate O-acetylesterase
MKKRSSLAALIALLLASLAANLNASEPPGLPFLHPLFSEHAVLQRGVRLPIWGWTSPGAKVTVALGGQTVQAVAGADGRWEAKLKPFKAGGPHTLQITGPQSVTVNDILFGDVWLCSGQSNMEMGIGACNATNDIATADLPGIRLLTVPRLVSAKPQATMSCLWLPCSPANVQQGVWGGFSAAGFFFGRELHRELGVPIGLIHSSWGGTIAEAWTSLEGLQPLPDFHDRLAKLPALPAAPDQNNPNISTVLYNGMIAPLLPFAIKGAIWYQGESNAGRAWQYRSLLPAMIKDWRARFGVGNFSFYIVQLAAFQKTNAEPRENDWAELREAQTFTAKTVPSCGLAVAIDIGDANDIHPKNKLEVGRRLALCALANTYQRKVEFSGPCYRSMKKTDHGIRLSFDHVGSGLKAQGDKLTGFAVAGEDRKFVWADATIQGKTILVSSANVANPVAVRYAWDINPVCNLFNQNGLPAVPFRTDDWPAVTAKNK